MPEVSIEINGRKYRMACEDGQEEHLQNLAARFNIQLDEFKGDFGEVGDNRLTVMAGIAIVDALVEAEKSNEKLRLELEEISQASHAMAAATEAMELRFAGRMSEASRKIESAATAIELANRDGETA